MPPLLQGQREHATEVDAVHDDDIEAADCKALHKLHAVLEDQLHLGRSEAPTSIGDKWALHR